MSSHGDQIKKIAITTGGGDAPGFNAVIRAATLSALNRGWQVYGIRDGYNGILMPEQFIDGGLIRLTRDSVRGITHLGGTILGTTNKGNPLRFPVRGLDGQIQEVDRSEELIREFLLHGLDALISIGGDGSMEIAHALSQKGLWVVGVPKTIDNDLNGTVITFGFDTATIVRHRMPGSAAFYCCFAPKDHRGRSNGSLCRLDCAGMWCLLARRMQS